MTLEQRAEWQLGIRAGQITRRIAVETHDVHQHAPEARTQQVTRLGEQTRQIAARVLKTAVLERGGEGHVAGVGGHPKFVKQGHQIRIVGRVIDNESSVDGKRAPVIVHRHGIAVATERGARLKQRDLMLAVEQPRGTQAGYPGTDYRNTQWCYAPALILHAESSRWWPAVGYVIERRVDHLAIR